MSPKLIFRELPELTMSLYSLSVGTFIPKLSCLSIILGKGISHARSKSLETTLLGASRLAPDMFPLVRQVQLACDHAKEAAARLRGQQAPKFEQTEQTLEELQVRIARTLDYLRSIPDDLSGPSAQSRIQKPLLNNRILDLPVLEFLRDWALPQFYFHLVTAYDILRQQGVAIGKWDYLGDLSACIRQSDS